MHEEYVYIIIERRLSGSFCIPKRGEEGDWMEEREILERMKKKDETALTELMTTYETYLSRVIENIIGRIMTKEDIKEVVSDVFYNIWRHADTINLEKGSLRAYLTVSARNQAKNKMRDLKKNPVSLPIQEEDYIEITDFCQGLEREERIRILAEALRCLKSDEREIMLRYYFLYETTETISKSMGIQKNTVKSKLMRGRKKLKVYLQERGICQ